MVICMDFEAQLKKAVNIIVENYNPIAIYLFGSASRNELREDSDIDLGFLTQYHVSIDEYSKFMLAQELADIFKRDAKKYTDEELITIIAYDNTPIFVAVDEQDEVLGYAFCQFIQHINNNILTDIKTLYIDDLCVDEKFRGQHIAHALFDHVCHEAAAMDCYEIALNVWEGNDNARRFYDRMGFKPKSTTMEFILK